MKKVKILFFTAIIIIMFSACNKLNSFISDAEAKNAITEYSPGAIITECTLHSESALYEIEFKTSHNVYIGYINARTGNVDSVSVKEEIIPEDNSVFTDEPETEDVSFIATDTALAIAIKDANVSGSVVLVKNELNRENKTFTCIFRAGNREFTYIINATTGDIISSETELDS